MKSKNILYKRFGERAILVEWKKEIDRGVLEEIINFKEKIEKNSIKQIVDLKLSFNSLLIIYENKIKNYKDEVAHIDKIYNEKYISIKSRRYLWKIPACYESEYAPDLNAFSEIKKMNSEDVVKLHTAHSYLVYFIGFLPGFLYLGGLDDRLHLPRKASPELKVPKGAVAIGGNQTGVYPNESPGGWHVIGNTPISFFDVSKDTPCFAKPGDEVVFYEINKKKYEDIKMLVDSGVYEIEREVIRD